MPPINMLGGFLKVSGGAIDVFSAYSLREVSAELWWGYNRTLALAGIWLGYTIAVVSRQRHVRSYFPLVGANSGPDFWTVPIMLVCFQAVSQLLALMGRCGAAANPQAELAAIWLVSAAGFGAVVVSLAVSTLAALISRVALGTGVSFVPRVGFPGVVALLSLTLAWLLIAYVAAIYSAA